MIQKNNYLKQNAESILAYTALILLIAKSYNTILFNLNNNLFLALFGILAFFAIYLKPNKLKIAVVLVSSLLFLISKNGMFLFSTLVVCSTSLVDFKKLAKVYLHFELTLFTIVLVLNNFDIIPSNYFNTDTLIRTDFGFGNPNTTSIKIFSIALVSIYLYSKKELDTKKLAIYSLVFPCLILIKTFTRTAIGIYILFMILFALYLKTNILSKLFYNKSFQKFVVYFPPILFVLSVITALFFSNSSILNKVLSQRPTIWNDILFKFKLSPTLFGRDNSVLSILSNEFNYSLDNAYISLISIDGLVVGFLTLSALSLTIYITLKKKLVPELLLVLAFIIYAFMENILINASMNISLLIVGQAIFENKLILTKSIFMKNG